MVAEIDETAAEFICMSMFASELRGAAGLVERGEVPEGLVVVVAGRCETQSWTRRLTAGLERRLWVLREDGLEVIIIVGPAGNVEGRGEGEVAVLVAGGADGR